MPRRALLRRTFGVLAAALALDRSRRALVACARGRRAGLRTAAACAVRCAARPPAPCFATLVLDRAEARALDFDVQSNTFDNQYPPNLSATFRLPLPGQTPNSPMVTEFWAGGFLLGKAENLQGHSRPGNVVVVVLGVQEARGGIPQPARTARSLRPALGAQLVRSRGDPALAARHGRERSAVGARACARARDGGPPAGRRIDAARPRSGGARDRRQDQVRAVHLRLLARTGEAPGPLDVRRTAELAAYCRTTISRAGSTRSRGMVRARPDARDRLHDDAAARSSAAVSGRSGCGAARRRSSRSHRSTATTSPTPGRSRRRKAARRRCGRRRASAACTPRRRTPCALRRASCGPARAARRPLLGARAAAAPGRRLRAAGHSAAAVAPGAVARELDVNASALR